MKKAVAYIRVSTQEQSLEGVSLENQRKRIKAFCVAKDWNLIDTYEERRVMLLIKYPKYSYGVSSQLQFRSPY